MLAVPAPFEACVCSTPPLHPLNKCSPNFTEFPTFPKVQVTVDFASADGTLGLRASATTVAFPGYLAVYSDPGAAAAAAAEADGEDGLGAGAAAAPADSSGAGEEEGEATPQSAAAAAAAASAALRALSKGDAVCVAGVDELGHETRPPGRFTEGSLVCCCFRSNSICGVQLRLCACSLLTFFSRPGGASLSAPW